MTLLVDGLDLTIVEILGIASLRHEYKGTILNITLDEHNNVVVPAYIIQHVWYTSKRYC
jgi:hypothetical protein